MPPKAHLNGSEGDPQKGIFLTPKMSFSRFSNFDLCRGTLYMGKTGTIWQFFSCFIS